MLDQSPERWANFQRRVEELQAAAPPGVQYKALFLGRHGQGWHNFCSDKYGVEVSLQTAIGAIVFTPSVPSAFVLPLYSSRRDRSRARSPPKIEVEGRTAGTMLTFQKWEAEMAYLNGDDECTWGPDPELTPLGHEQTKAVGAAWKREAAAGAPIAKMRWFTSPLQRTCQTMLNSWGDMLGPPETWEVSARAARRRECSDGATGADYPRSFAL